MFQEVVSSHKGEINTDPSTALRCGRDDKFFVVRDLKAQAHRLERLETVAAIRVGLKDAKEGRVQPARKALTSLGAKLGIQR